MSATATVPRVPEQRQPVPRIVDRFFEFSLLGMLAAGYFAVVGSGYLDWPTATLTLAGLCLRALMVAGIFEITFSNRLVAAITLVYIGFYPLDYFFISASFLTATVHLVCFLAVLKVLTATTNRDYTYVKMIAVMELLAAAVLSSSLSFFGYLAFFLLCAVATFSSGEVRRSAQMRGAVVRGGLRAFPRRLSMLAMFLFSGILVMTVGMFFVLPRTARAALERFVPNKYHVPGFSNGVTLGEIGEIKQSSVPVMHVQSYQPGEGLLRVRWRGGSLSRFDGKRWDNPPSASVELPVEHGLLTVNKRYRPATRPGRTLIYQVQLNDITADTLFIGGTPQTIRVNLPFVRLTPSGTFNVLVPASHSGLSYGVYSFLEDETADVSATPEPLSMSMRKQLLQLPDIDPRIPRLAREMASGAIDEEDKANALERHLRRDYGYTLQLLSASVPDPLANFLFVRKKGHCEYFASSMAVMLRTLGIPSRVVTGFQSGVYNPMTGLQVVRASDAHSWVEAWISGRGWTTYDPTPADPNISGNGVMARMFLFFDAAEQFWQDWVVSYDLDHQVMLASRMDESARRVRFHWFDQAREWAKNTVRATASHAPAALMGIAVAVLLLLLGPRAWTWWRARLRVRRLVRGQGNSSDATLLYERMLRVLARRKIQKPGWLTPAEFARVIPASEVTPIINELTHFYNEFRFGGRTDVASRMIVLLDQLEKM